MNDKDIQENLFTSIKIDGHIIPEATIESDRNGDAKTINTMAESYYRHLDFEKAILWYRRSAARNDAEAQNRMGDIYYRGQGVTLDHSLALEWYTKSANQGDRIGMRRIAEMREIGHGAPTDRGIAMYHYYQAFLLGDNSVLVHLGDMLKKSNEPYEALMWYLRSSERGNEEGRKKAKELNENNVWLTLNSKTLIKSKQRLDKLKELMVNINSDHHDSSYLEEVTLLKEKIKSLELKLELKEKQLEQERLRIYEEAGDTSLKKRVKILEVLVASMKTDGSE